MATDKPAPTQAEVAALIAKLCSWAESPHEPIGNKILLHDSAAMLRLLAATVPQAAPERAPSGDADDARLLKRLRGEWNERDGVWPVIDAMNEAANVIVRLLSVEKSSNQALSRTEALESALAEARAEIARLKPDAERYDLFRRQLIPGHGQLLTQLANCISGAQFDAAIDAALQEKAK